MNTEFDHKKAELKSLIERLHDGEDTELVKVDFKAKFGEIQSSELSAVEDALIADGMPVEEITRLCSIHADVFADNILSQPNAPSERPGHPAFVFKAENQGLTEHIEKKVKPAVAADDTVAFLDALKTLQKVHTHYQRKENIFFPLLEKHGVYGPPKVMWNVDDEIREELKSLYEKVQYDGSPKRHEKDVEIALANVLSMVTKENNILIPMLEEHLTHDEWLLAANESAEIGYVFSGGIEGGSPSDAIDWARRHAGSGSEPVPHKTTSSEITLPSGHFTKETLTAMLNSLPIDLTFVGADDKVAFFSETKDRIFPRTRTIIGREVANCHPQKSLHVVETLINQLKSGEKDSETFWIQQGGAFILIRYFAVRDENGKYLGVVETTENIAPFRALEGNKTLMDE